MSNADLKNLLGTASRPMAAIVQRITLGGFGDDFVERTLIFAQFVIVNRGLSKQTAVRYLVWLENWAKWCNSSNIDPLDCALRDAEEYSRYLFHPRKLAAASRCLALSALRQFYGFIYRDRNESNPLQQLQGPKLEKKVPRRFSSSQMAKMFAACDRETAIGIRNHAILALMYCTGGRRSEVAGLRLNQITITSKLVTILFFGKGSKERIVATSGPAVESLQRWIGARDLIADKVDDSLFLSLSVNHIGHQLSSKSVESMINVVKKKANIKAPGLGAHAFRVAFATDLYDDGVDLERIRALMGHESIETTRRYIASTQKQSMVALSTDRVYKTMGLNKPTPLWFQRQLAKKS